MSKYFLTLLCFLFAVTSVIAEEKTHTMGVFEQQLLHSSETTTVIQFNFPIKTELISGTDIAISDIEWKQPGEVLQLRKDELIYTDPVSSALLAVPSSGSIQWEVVSSSWHITPENSSASDAVTLSHNSVYRGINLRSLKVSPIVNSGLLSSIKIKVIHQPAGQFSDISFTNRYKKTGLGVVNPQMFAACTVATERDPVEDIHLFSMTSNWVRLEMTDTAVYEVDGYSLASVGIADSSIDPFKLRVFRAFPGLIPENPDNPGSMDPGWNGFTEIPIQVDSDGVWSSADRVVFYGVGPDCWKDRINSSALPLDHLEHQYSSNSVYWLTWEDYDTATPFAGDPLRIASEAAIPTDQNNTRIFRERLHLEQSNSEAYGRVLDNWVWQSSIYSNVDVEFQVDKVVPDSSTVVVLDIRTDQRHTHGENLVNQASMWLNDGDNIGEAAELEWVSIAEEDSARVRLVSEATNLVDGSNTISLQRLSPSGSPALLLDSADLFYWAELEKNSREQFDFYHWSDQVQTTGQPFDLTVVVPVDEEVHSWDVTSADNPVELTGELEANSFKFGIYQNPDEHRRFVMFSDTDLDTPDAISRWFPQSLRSMDTDVQYIVIFDPEFSNAADILTSFRDTDLPGYDDPNAIAVNANDIYDYFGGGVKDPLAIRNFLEWLFNRSLETNVEHPLMYVCIVGDTSRDYRGFKGQYADFVPSFVRNKFPSLLNGYSSEPYGSDDALVSFDDPGEGNLDVPDLAIGRLTVRTAEEADNYVDRIVGYEWDPEPGIWSNSVVFVADDLTTPSHSGEIHHMRQAELLTEDYLPQSIDVKKLYLEDYESPPGGVTKPLARQAARQYLNSGLSIFHYIGHGAENTLADEQVFITDDIYSLSNGMRRGIFIAFSCDVGVYDSTSRQSMAEVFISQESGGTIAAIAASQVSWVFQNDTLSRFFYQSLYPEQQVIGTSTLGGGLNFAKVLIGTGSPFSMANSQRYLLYGDPGLRLSQPVSDLGFSDSCSDTLGGGRTENIEIILSDYGITPGSQVSYDLFVQESRHDMVTDEYSFHYWLPGSATFHGTGIVDSDTLVVPFKVPLQLQYGDFGKMRLVINDGINKRSTSVELPVAQVPLEPNDDFTGPIINLAFEDDRYRVRSGTMLNGAIQDTSGVSILGTNPGNSILLEFDSTGLMTDVSELFQFDSGSYTAGRISIPLPDDLSLGEHSAALLASDVLGNVGTDTLSFQVVASTLTSIEDVTLFPNPSSGPARLLFEASDPMDINWDIYTTAGDHIWGFREQFTTGGPKIIEWDGRDKRGDFPANGVYLFVLQALPLAGDNHVITKTGHVVIMR